MKRLVLAAAILAAARAGADAGVALTSATVNQPYDLIKGTVAPPSELKTVPWFPESLKFEIKWGLLFVGWSTMKAQTVENFNGQPAVRIVSEATSSKFCDSFYKVRDVNEAWIHAKEFHSLGYYKKLREGNFFRDEWVLYDYPRKAWLGKQVNKDGAALYRSGSLPGPVQDILSSLYFLRTKPLKVGDEVVLDVNTRDNWPLVIKVTKKQRIEVPAGEFDTIVVEPFIRQEGIFIQKGKRMQVWLTDDKRHLPVYLSVDVFFGSVTAALMTAE